MKIAMQASYLTLALLTCSIVSDDVYESMMLSVVIRSNNLSGESSPKVSI